MVTPFLKVPYLTNQIRQSDDAVFLHS